MNKERCQQGREDLFRSAIEAACEQRCFSGDERSVLGRRMERLRGIPEELLSLFDVRGWKGNERPKEEEVGNALLYLLERWGREILATTSEGAIRIVTDVKLPLVMVMNLTMGGAKFIEIKGQPLVVTMKLGETGAVLE